MGLFDQLAGQVGGELLSKALGGGAAAEGAGGANMAQAVLGLIQNHQGGLLGLLGTLQSSGIASQVSSWIGNGANEPVEGHQLTSALGSDFINNLAGKIGLSPEMASSALASVLPQIVDKLTPGGKVEEHPDLMSQGMAMLGGLFGNKS